MTGNDDLQAVRDALTGLRRAVLHLEASQGDSVDMRRLRDDVARTSADLDLVARSSSSPPRTGDENVVYIPEGDYGLDFWADADDEGLGAHGRP
jgi:hypothetical protein